MSESDFKAGSDGDRFVYRQIRRFFEESRAIYLVLTQDYGGNCLLLREHLLDNPRIYNEPGRKASYYGESDIDRFLNEEFARVYSDELR